MSVSITGGVKNSSILSNLRQGWSSYSASSIHRSGANMLRFNLGIAPLEREMVNGSWTGKLTKGHVGWKGRAFGLGLTAFSVYQGYKEGGVSGAIRSGAEALVQDYAVGAGFKALGIGMKGVGTYAGVALAGAAIGATIGGAIQGVAPWGVNASGAGWMAMLARPAVAEHSKKLAHVEMGRPVLDQFGTVATMRQRSIQAIQNSKINGRSGLSHEATYAFRSYFR